MCLIKYFFINFIWEIKNFQETLGIPQSTYLAQHITIIIPTWDTKSCMISIKLRDGLIMKWQNWRWHTCLVEGDILKIMVLFLQYSFPLLHREYILLYPSACRHASTTKLATRLFEFSISSKLLLFGSLHSKDFLKAVYDYYVHFLPMVAPRVKQMQILSSFSPEYVSKLLMFLPFLLQFYFKLSSVLTFIIRKAFEKLPHIPIAHCHYLQNSQNHLLLDKSMIRISFT